MAPDGMVKVELHGPDGEVETLWATPVAPDQYQLENSPFFAYGVSWLDIVEAHRTGDGEFPVFTRVVQPSGHRTLRLILKPGADEAAASQAVLERLNALGASYEGYNSRYLAIDIPPRVVLAPITEYLTDTGQQWEYVNPTYEQVHGSQQPSSDVDDTANGYERIADQFLAARGRASTGIGVAQVRAWARSLPPHATVLDLGAGSGLPLAKVLLDEGLTVYAVDASPTLVAAFRSQFPDVAVACESVEQSDFFGRRFDAILAWGLWFLLPPATQLDLLGRIASALNPGGRLLFTAPAQACTWLDVMTGQESRSLGAEAYRSRLTALGFRSVREYEDEGENHYYDARMR